MISLYLYGKIFMNRSFLRYVIVRLLGATVHISNLNYFGRVGTFGSDRKRMSDFNDLTGRASADRNCPYLAVVASLT